MKWNIAMTLLALGVMGIGYAVGCSRAEAAGPTFRELGIVTLTVGSSLNGLVHGFKRGEYGYLEGALPSAFFTTSGDRQISELTESVVDGRVVWRIAVPGARPSSWAADLDVVWETIHEDQVDTRRFVVEDFDHARGVALSLRPPLPPGQRDCQSRVGQEVTIIMTVGRAPVAPTPSPSHVEYPSADAMSFSRGGFRSRPPAARSGCRWS